MCSDVNSQVLSVSLGTLPQNFSMTASLWAIPVSAISPGDITVS